MEEHELILNSSPQQNDIIVRGRKKKPHIGNENLQIKQTNGDQNSPKKINDSQGRFLKIGYVRRSYRRPAPINNSEDFASEENADNYSINGRILASDKSDTINEDKQMPKDPNENGTKEKQEDQLHNIPRLLSQSDDPRPPISESVKLDENLPNFENNLSNAKNSQSLSSQKQLPDTKESEKSVKVDQTEKSDNYEEDYESIEISESTYSETSFNPNTTSESSEGEKSSYEEEEEIETSKSSSSLSTGYQEEKKESSHNKSEPEKPSDEPKLNSPPAKDIENMEIMSQHDNTEDGQNVQEGKNEICDEIAIAHTSSIHSDSDDNRYDIHDSSIPITRYNVMESEPSEVFKQKTGKIRSMRAQNRRKKKKTASSKDKGKEKHGHHHHKHHHHTKSKDQNGVDVGNAAPRKSSRRSKSKSKTDKHQPKKSQSKSTCCLLL